MQSKGDWKSTAERRKGQTTYGGKVSRQGAGLSAAQSADRESFSTDNSLCSELFFQNEDKIKSPSTNQKKKKKSLQKLRKKSRKHRSVQDKIRKFAPGCKSTESLFYREPCWKHTLAAVRGVLNDVAVLHSGWSSSSGYEQAKSSQARADVCATHCMMVFKGYTLGEKKTIQGKVQHVNMMTRKGNDSNQIKKE